MRLQVLKVGKPTDKAYDLLARKYQQRLKGFCRIESTILKAQDGLEKSTRELLNRLGIESTKLIKDPAHALISLDERGANLSSPKLAQKIRCFMDDRRIKQLSFVVGGPYGIPGELRIASNHIWSLSEAVFPSDMAWVMVWEQIYRASTIIRGTPYHHQ